MEITELDVNRILEEIFNNSIINKLSRIIPMKGRVRVLKYLDFETTPGEISLQTKNKNIALSDYKVSAAIPQNMGLIIDEDVVRTMALSAIINEAKLSVIKEIIKKINFYAEIASSKTLTKKELRIQKRRAFIGKHLQFLQKYISRLFKSEYKKECIIKERNYAKAVEKIIHRIYAGSSMIAAKCRIGPGTSIIVGTQMAGILQYSPQFTYMNTEMHSGMPHIIGQLGNLSVIIDPYKHWNELDVVILRNEQSEDSYGLATLYNTEAFSIMEKMEKKFDAKLILSTMYSSEFVGPNDKASNYYEKVNFKLSGLRI